MDEKRIYESCGGSRRRVEASGPRLNGAARQKANAAISAVLKNKLWDKPYHALNKVEDALKGSGLSLEGSRSADVFLGDSGSRRLSVYQDGDELANTVLSMSWGKSGDQGRFDVTCYLS
jgi:hypothetical protein